MKYWFYIGYTHRTVVSKYVFLLHALNKKEGIIKAEYWVLSKNRKN